MSDPTWRRPSRCDSGTCVRVAFTDDAVHVGDTKYPKAPPIIYDRHSWQLILDAVKFGGSPMEIAGRLTDVLYLDELAEYCWRTEEFCLHFDEAEWDAFIVSAQAGEFDLPAVTA